ncbi:213_t:CDS:2, partial [Racocetra persica]
KTTRISMIKYYFETHHKESYDRLQSTLWIICDQKAFQIIENKDFYKLILALDLQFKHTEVFITKNIIEQVEYFGLGTQLLSLTIDNTANIDACGYYLASLFELYYNKDFCRIRYTSHILNLAVKEGILVLDKSIKKA